MVEVFDQVVEFNVENELNADLDVNDLMEGEENVFETKEWLVKIKWPILDKILEFTDFDSLKEYLRGLNYDEIKSFVWDIKSSKKKILKKYNDLLKLKVERKEFKKKRADDVGFYNNIGGELIIKFYHGKKDKKIILRIGPSSESILGYDYDNLQDMIDLYYEKEYLYGQGNWLSIVKRHIKKHLKRKRNWWFS